MGDYLEDAKMTLSEVHQLAQKKNTVPGDYIFTIGEALEYAKVCALIAIAEQLAMESRSAAKE